MFSHSIRYVGVVLVGALLVGCGNDDKPSSSSNGGSGGDGSDNAAGMSDTSGSAGKTNAGGAKSNGGEASGGTTENGGVTSTGGNDADGGQPPTGNDGDPPALDGDGISWTWNGKTYTANEKPASGFYPAVQSMNISASDSETAPPPNQASSARCA